MSQPLALEVLPSTAFWAKRFPIMNVSGAEVGMVCEPQTLAMRLEYGLHLHGTTRSQPFSRASARATIPNRG